jgi:hypothetical protein
LLSASAVQIDKTLKALNMLLNAASNGKSAHPL